MKLLALMGAGMIAAASLTAAPASAQHDGHGRAYGYGHRGGYRHHGYGYGYRYGHRGYGWRRHHYPHCRVVYRFGHRERRCW